MSNNIDYYKLKYILNILCFSSYCSNLLEKTTEAVIKAAKTSDLATVILEFHFPQK